MKRILLAISLVCAVVGFCLLARQGDSQIRQSRGTQAGYSAIVHPVTGDADSTLWAAVKRVQQISPAWTHTATAVHTDGDYGCVFFKDAKHHLFYQKGTSIYYSHSVNGTTGWTDVGAVLEKGAGGQWDATSVGVPCVWYDTNAGCWCMLYRGLGVSQAGVGFATAAAPEGPWTKVGAGLRQGQLIDNMHMADGGAEDCTAVIESGGVYYVFTNSTGGDRLICGFTSAETPDNWTDVCDDDEISDEFTLVRPYPLFGGMRFCPCVWKVGSVYYMAVPHMHQAKDAAKPEYVMELWSSTHPGFQPRYRKFLGVILAPETSVDTPYVVCTDETRDTYASTPPKMYFSKGSGTGVFVSTDVDVAEYCVPKKGKIFIKPGTYTFTPHATISSYPGLILDYGIVVEGYGVTLKLADSTDQNVSRLVAVCDEGTVLRGVTIDGNSVNQGAGLMYGADVSFGGRVEDVTVENWRTAGLYNCNAGRLIDCRSRFNQDGYQVSSNIYLERCQAYANTNDGMLLYGDRATVRAFESHHNAGKGLLLYGSEHSDLDVYLHDNGEAALADSTSNKANYCTIRGQIRDHPGAYGYGFAIYGSYNLLDGLVVENCAGDTDRQNYIDGDNNRITNCRFFKGAADSNYAIYWTANSSGNILQNSQHDCNTGLAEDGAAAANTERDNP